MYSPDFAVYLAHARTVFGTSISEEVLAVGHRYVVHLPDAIGGHDDNRNTDALNTQQGGGASADAHGINQGKQWSAYRAKVEKEFKKRTNLNPTKKLMVGSLPEKSKGKEEKEGPAFAPACREKKYQDPSVGLAKEKKREEERVAKQGTINDLEAERQYYLHSTLHMLAIRSGGMPDRVKEIEAQLTVLRGKG